MSGLEFDIIRRYFDVPGLRAEPFIHSVNLGIGDDCALLEVKPGEELAISTDTLVAGVHFPDDSRSFDIAQRALAANLSDLAAMGARPLGFTLSISLPNADEDWLRGFSRGLSVCAQHFMIPLIGGDTTRGPTSITITVLGAVHKGLAMRRDQAELGDLIYVTGTLGDAALALDLIQGRQHTDDSHYFLQRFYKPEPPLEFAQALVGLAKTAIDISDGLVADLGHIAHASGLAAELFVDNLPLSPQALQLMEREALLRKALTGGDDYELCFTLAQEKAIEVEHLSQELGVKCTQVGRMVFGDPGVSCRRRLGTLFQLESEGYEHFQ